MSSEKAPMHEAYKPGSSNIEISGQYLVDNHGRVLDLRGANVSSSSKVYVPHSSPKVILTFSPAKVPSRIDRHTESSYVGRPFPLEEADEHWARLKSWGLTFCMYYLIRQGGR